MGLNHFDLITERLNLVSIIQHWHSPPAPTIGCDCSLTNLIEIKTRSLGSPAVGDRYQLS